MPAKIRIATFGTLQVQRGDYLVSEGDWHTRQARQLLKILVTERPRPVSSDRLIEILWPNSTPSAAATTLRSAINALRNVLEPDRPNRAPSRYILTQAPGYAFHLHPDIWLDVDVFQKELEISQQTAAPDIRAAHLQTAIDLYRDDYLVSDPYADWIQNERERLQELYFNALLQIAELRAGSGDYAGAIAACRQVLARDPARELAYQGLMRYQAEAGDSAGALLTYERCRTLLSEELGADPSPLTQQLHQRILNGEIAAAVPPAPLQVARRADSAHLLPPSEPIAHALPQFAVLPPYNEQAIEHFVGRDAELMRLAAALQRALSGRGDLCVITGEAGVGKTRLGVHLLQRAVVSGASVLSGACQALEQQLPFAPLAHILGRYLQSLPVEYLADLPTASLAQVAQIIPSLQDRLPNLPPPGGDGVIGADENRLRVVEGIVAVLAALARLRPLVIFIDDLHWCDHDSLAVLGRLAQRITELPMLLLLAYRNDDLDDNEELVTLLHALRRLHTQPVLTIQRLSQDDLQRLVDRLVGVDIEGAKALADALYRATQGNPLFVTEALRDLTERNPTAISAASELAQAGFSLRNNRHVQEVIRERIHRLPDASQNLLRLAAVIGRDFSLELLELSAEGDPLESLDVLINRGFLTERPDARLDFSHQVVRQVAYDSAGILQRRRCHARVAEAMERLEQPERHAQEIAFHLRQAGRVHQPSYSTYSVLAGEQLLRGFGFRQAITQFDEALAALENQSAPPPDLVRRALQGRALAYEGLLDPDGVTDTYRRLTAWAAAQNDRELLLTTHARFTTVLTLVGRRRESNQLLAELVDVLNHSDGKGAASRVLVDLVERRHLFYSIDDPDVEDTWACYTPPPPAVSDPVADVLQVLEPVYAVLPLFDYGWTLMAQGQLGEATACLEAVIDLANQTSQPSIAGAAYRQLAVTARMLGDLEQSRLLNEQSTASSRETPGAVGELASMLSRLDGAFLALQAGRPDEAADRLLSVVDFLSERPSFANFRQSANIGLGLVALAQGQLDNAETLLEEALADPLNLFPSIYIRALLGLARINALRGRRAAGNRYLRRALTFSGKRSLLEEYIAAIQELVRVQPDEAPITELIRSVLDYTEAIQLETPSQLLRDALRRSNTARQLR